MAQTKSVFRKISRTFKKLSKPKKALAFMAVLAIITPAAIFADWGPSNRPTFDYNSNRAGSLDGPVFNSYINTPSYGDERDFTTINDPSNKSQWKDTVNIDGTKEQEILVRAYVHNNGNSGYNGQNGNDKSVAKNTRVRFDFVKDEFHNKLEVRGYITADNAKPPKIWDGAYLQDTSNKFKLEYVPGSAKFYNYNTYKDGVALGDAITTTSSGVQIGSRTLGGDYLGCFDEAGAVYIRVKVVPQPKEPEPKPSYTIKKYVNGSDAQDNASAVKVKLNEQFEYRVDVTNTGDTELKNVKAWDVLPAGVNYVDNTLKLEGATVANDEDFFNSAKGVVIPSIAKASKKSFTFKAIIKADTEAQKEEKCAPNTGTFYNNVAKADPEGTLPEQQDPAVVNCDYTPPKNEPAVDIEKSVSKNTLMVGEVFTYVLKIKNTGNVDLKNVKVDDPAPTNIVFNTYQQMPDITVDFNQYRVKATISELKVGQTKEIILTAKVVRYVTGQLINTACVNADEVNPSKPEQNDDCASAPVTVVEPCPISGKENLPKGDANCSTPNEVPSTGAGSAIAVSSALLVAALAFLASNKMSKAKSKKSKN